MVLDHIKELDKKITESINPAITATLMHAKSEALRALVKHVTR